MGRQEYEITRTKRACYAFVFKPQPCRAAQDHYPFIGVLIVPVPVRGGLTMGNDPLDPQAVSGQQCVEDLAGISRRQVCEKLSEFKRVPHHPG